MICDKCKSTMMVAIEYDYTSKKDNKDYTYKFYICTSDKVPYCKCHNEVEVREAKG